MRKILERILTACEKVMTEAQDVRCQDECPDKIKVDMVQIFLEMSLMDNSIPEESEFVSQLREIIYPMNNSSTENCGDQENGKIKEEHVDFVEEPPMEKWPKPVIKNDSTSQKESRYSKRNKLMTKTQLMIERESSPKVVCQAATNKYFRNPQTPKIIKTESHVRNLHKNDFDQKGLGTPESTLSLPTAPVAPKSRPLDLSELKDLDRGDVIWVKKPNGEEIICKFVKLCDVVTWRVQVEVGGRTAHGNQKPRKTFLYMSLCQWGIVEIS